jgi:hypothetical protein
MFGAMIASALCAACESTGPTAARPHQSVVRRNSSVALVQRQGAVVSDGPFTFQATSTLQGTDSLLATITVTNTGRDSTMYTAPALICQVAIQAVTESPSPDTVTIAGGPPDTSAIGTVCPAPALGVILGPGESKVLPLLLGERYAWDLSALPPGTYDVSVNLLAPLVPAGTVHAVK